MSNISSRFCLLPLMVLMMTAALTESRHMVPPKSAFVSKNDDHKPVPKLESSKQSPPSQPSRNDHQVHDEFYNFVKNVEAYKAALTGPSQKGRGHK
ncbi:hypothetical protein L1987_44221 [Smallanthus sonchifolius]|uniref:Uncharacterized protein n=1 Tax=Smallanthus sonchifolius TaxID=185202 RepID=A0ACB9GN90_9ASTR|nr:hypothetical protein L1987_44221 [Smallanthus sonchifolius]